MGDWLVAAAESRSGPSESASEFAGGLSIFTLRGEEATVGSTTGVAGSGQLPRVCALHQSHPNPGRFGSTIAFDLPVATEVTLKVFDTVGRLTTSLVSQRMDPGAHSMIWDGTNSAGRVVPSGVYFYRMEAGDFTDTKKLLITW